ncbi:MAG: four helix bundle protein [Ferruginibacter sp.]
MKENVVKIKSFDFAFRIVKLYQYLTSNKKECVLSKQLLRSGTAIGALIREAEHAESKADFIHKLSISLKEANESDYWLELLCKSGYLTEEEYNSIIKSLKEIFKLLISIIKTSKENKYCK